MRGIATMRGNMSTMVESQTRHQWRSPVPYLFGGLAAMLGLIAFSLLLLACSYWKLSRRETNDGDGEKQTESGEKVTANIFEEKILVIMAGQNKPTFLATPVPAMTCVNTEIREGQNRESTVTEVSSSSSSDEETHH